jgi:hypothetical protein
MTQLPGSGTTGRRAGTAELAEVFVSLADTLVDDYDVVDLMGRLTATCVDYLGASAAGLMVVDLRGSVQVIASSSEQMHILEVLQVQSDEGPCRDCVRSGAVVTVPDLSQAQDTWPRFATVASTAGFTASQALPLRLRSEALGALNLLFAGRPVLAGTELRIAQALADVATIGVLQQRAVHRGAVVAEQLQRALNSRVVIEQAKGMLAQHLGQDMDAAFTVLRTYSRNHNLRLTDLASALASGEVSPEEVSGRSGIPPRPSE